MKLKVNGEPVEFSGKPSVPALLALMGADASRTAVVLNGKVISSGDWETVELKEHDEVELLVFVGGG